MLDTKNHEALVGDQFGARANAYLTSAVHAHGRDLEALVALASNHPDARVLDLGCGGGRRAAQRVAARHRYLGVDISPVQIERARRQIPQGRFLVADATEFEPEPESFDAVMSLFVFGHVPLGEQAPLLARVHGWLRPGGWFLTTLGTGGSDDAVEDDWLGAPMFFASFDPATNRRLLADAGFDIVQERVITHDEPGHGPVSFMWVLARRER
jgi:SAM-dependent methyltransferase